MAQGVRRLVAIAGIGGEVDSLEQLFGELAGSLIKSYNRRAVIVGDEEPARRSSDERSSSAPGGSTATITPSSTSAHVPSMRRP
jgi:hypothetical protein